MAEIITCNICGSDGPFCGTPEVPTFLAVNCPRRLVFLNQVFPLGIFSPRVIGGPENPDDPIDPYAVRNPDIIFHYLRACMDYLAGGSKGPDPTKVVGYEDFGKMTPAEQRIWHHCITTGQTPPGYEQPQGHDHVAENHASGHDQIPEHADDLSGDETVSDPDIPDNQRSGYSEVSENGPAFSSTAPGGGPSGSDSSDEDFSPNPDTSDDSHASDYEDAYEIENLEVEYLYDDLDFPVGIELDQFDRELMDSTDYSEDDEPAPAGIELDQFDRELMDSTDYSEDDEPAPASIETDQFKKAHQNSTDPENGQSDHSEDPRPAAASTRTAVPSAFTSDFYSRGSTRLLAKKISMGDVPHPAVDPPRQSTSRQPAPSKSLPKQRGKPYKPTHVVSDDDEADDEAGFPQAQRKPRPSLGKRNRSSKRCADDDYGANVNDGTDNESDYMPPTKKTKLQGQRGSGKTLADNHRASSGKSLSGGQRTSGGETAPGSHRAYGEKTLPGGHRAYGEKTLPGGHRAYGEKTLPGGHRAYGEKTLPGGKRPLSGKTLPDAAILSDDDEKPVVKNTPPPDNSTKAAKRPWTDEEHAAILVELKELRADEAEKGVTGKFVLRDENLWRHISNALLKYHHIDRSLAGCKYYWGRFGRVKSGYDERVNSKVGDKLTTSTQTKTKTAPKKK